MATNTTNFDLQKPTVGADTDVWGDMLNANMDKLDSKAMRRSQNLGDLNDVDTARGNLGLPTGDLDDRYARIPAGTRMLFQQTSAPTGWVKDTSSGMDNRALRMVTGDVGSGGNNSFTSAFNSNNGTSSAGSHSHSITVSGTALSLSQIPNATGSIQTSARASRTSTSGVFSHSEAGAFGHDAGNNNGVNIDFDLGGGGEAHSHSASSGSAGSHSHTVDLDVQYRDVIVATKQ